MSYIVNFEHTVSLMSEIMASLGLHYVNKPFEWSDFIILIFKKKGYLPSYLLPFFAEIK